MSNGSCSFCGERFDNVFEAVDHLQEGFNPKLIANASTKLGLGELLYQFYMLSGNPEVQGLAERTFALLYIAEKRPSKLYDVLTFPNSEYAIQYVYAIVGEDSWKKAGL